MKRVASDRSIHYTIDPHPSSLWNGSKENTTRCKSVDAFRYLMSIIENERYSDGNRGKMTSSDVTLRDRESWQSDFYIDDYDTDEDN